MHALSDDQQVERLEQNVERLEKKVDDGFAEMRTEFKAARSELRGEVTAARSEARADFRLLLGVLAGLYVTMILGFAALILQHHI